MIYLLQMVLSLAYRLQAAACHMAGVLQIREYMLAACFQSEGIIKGRGNQYLNSVEDQVALCHVVHQYAAYCR